MHIRRYMYINEASNLNNYIYKYVNMHILCSVKKYAYSTYSRICICICIPLGSVHDLFDIPNQIPQQLKNTYDCLDFTLHIFSMRSTL